MRTRIATGHYARVTHDARGYRLHLCADPDKDQTYFLHLLDQAQLKHALFPLHDLTKTEVREIARGLGLANAEKKDSTGICFIGERRFRDFLARYLPCDPGPIETAEGMRIGEHRGLAYYTIGQRQGLGIGGIHGSREAPWFVAAKDAERNTLVLVQDTQHPLLMSAGLHAAAAALDRRSAAGRPALSMPGASAPSPAPAALRGRRGRRIRRAASASTNRNAR